jgi:bifunctional non-homologous end joining protein LigD
MARRAPLPGFLPFQHPKLVARPPGGEGWLHEVKLDGYRMQLRIETGKATWYTRNGLDWTDRFPDLSRDLAALPDVIIDGELVALDAKGEQSFSTLRSAVGKRQAGSMEGDLVFYAFDLLWDGRDDVRTEPLEVRKARLEERLEGAAPWLVTVQPVEGRASELYGAACEMGLEGLVSKQLGSPYQGGDVRPDTWLKVKCRPVEEVVIGGWRAKGPTVNKLLAGVYEGDRLVYVGGVAPGGQKVLAPAIEKLRALEQPASPFVGRDQPERRDGVLHFCRPDLVGRVEIAEWTRSGKVRQGSFQGLREDKDPREIVRETSATVPAAPAIRTGSTEAAEVLGVAVSNPGKVLWPAHGGQEPVTKLDLARYYAAAAEWMVPYLEGRPTAVVAAPDGIDGPQTFVRHEGHWQGPLRTSPLIRHMEVEATGKTYPAFDSAKGLVAAADMALVELHPWNSMADEPMTPERLVFDLDPDEGQTFADVAAAAQELEIRLLDLGLIAFLKTSGKRGLHVVVPFEQFPKDRVSWKEARTFAEVLCRQMAADSPDRYTVALPKAQRRGRLFLDYLRNDPGHHAVGLLSPRVVPGAPVSMPIDWKALRERVEASAFTVRNASRLVREVEPWRLYDAVARPLRYAIARLMPR